MRLTNSIRSAFVSSVMNDVPSIDYIELMRKEANRIGRAMMPPEIAAVYDKYPKWFKEQWACIGSWYGYGPFPFKDTAFRVEDIQAIQAMDRLKQLEKEQSLALSRLRNQLQQAAASATTTKALAEMFPEFAKYLPAEETKTRNLPAIADVVADFMKAGWPKNRPA